MAVERGAHEVKHKQPCPGFELGTLSPFHRDNFCNKIKEYSVPRKWNRAVIKPRIKKFSQVKHVTQLCTTIFKN